MRWALAVVASLILAVGLTVGILAAWSSVRDPDVSHTGPVPALSFPARIDRQPTPLGPLSRPAALDTAIRQNSASLRDGLFSRPALGARHPVRGRVATTGPQAAVWAAAFGPALLSGPVAPGPDGAFELPAVPEGQVELCFGPDAHTLRTRWTWRQNLRVTGPVDLGELAVAGHALTVQVVHIPIRKPVDGVMLRLSLENAPEWQPWFPPAEGGQPAFRTGRDGSAVFPRIPAGRYLLEVLSVDPTPIATRTLEVRAAESITIEIPP